MRCSGTGQSVDPATAQRPANGIEIPLSRMNSLGTVIGSSRAPWKKVAGPTDAVAIRRKDVRSLRRDRSQLAVAESDQGPAIFPDLDQEARVVRTTARELRDDASALPGPRPGDIRDMFHTKTPHETTPPD